IFFY
ncbi:unnamed protein product, partial [Callosobruchus maculatus]